MNFYCWTKPCLFLDVRSEDHRIRPSSTRDSWRDSAPAGKAELSRVRFPQLSVQASVNSVRNYSVSRKNLSSQHIRILSCTISVQLQLLLQHTHRNFISEAMRVPHEASVEWDIFCTTLTQTLSHDFQKRTTNLLRQVIETWVYKTRNLNRTFVGVLDQRH